MKKGTLLIAALLALVALGFTGMNAVQAQGTVQGTVIDLDGAGVADAHVMIVSAVRERGVRPHHDRVETGEDGAFTFAEVPAGVYHIVAGLFDVGNARAEVEVADGEVTAVELQLEVCDREDPGEIETGSISGVVLDADGEPVVRARVAVMLRLRGFEGRGGMNFRNLHTVTDQNGEFVLETVPVGNHNIVANAMRLGMAREAVAVEVDQNTEIELTIEARNGGGNGGGHGGAVGIQDRQRDNLR